MKLYLFILFSLTKGENLLDLVSLKAHPLAQCNDGTPAVYYRRPLNSEQDVKKLLIYLQGGGMCLPLWPGLIRIFKVCQISLDNSRWWLCGEMPG